MKRFVKATACIAAISAMLINYGALAAPTPAPEAPASAETETAVDLQTTPDPEMTSAPEITSAPEVTSAPKESIKPTDSAAVSSQAPEVIPVSGPTASTLDFSIQIADKKYVVDSYIKVEVYDKNGTLAGTAREWIGGITKSVDLHYDVPEYRLGDSFTVKLVEGVDTLKYYDTVIRPGESFDVKTDFYVENGVVVPYNSYIFSAIPLWEKEVFVYVDGEKLSMPTRARIVNGSTFVPVRAVAEALGISVYYDERYDSVVCSVGDKEIIYNLGSTYATFFGEDIYLPAAPQYFGGSVCIPLRSLAEAFEAPIEAKDFGDHMDVVLGDSEVVINSSPVNKWNISSRTDYMVWVSKSEYKVRVYEGSTNKWRLLRTASCAIGAPGTPTITGSFEYIERTFWDYGSYYVGPVLRFHNGYALHSVLLYYGGGEYDGRTGVQISHGCVRLKAPDINWIANTIPLYTRIYITE